MNEVVGRLIYPKNIAAVLLSFTTEKGAWRESSGFLMPQKRRHSVCRSQVFWLGFSRGCEMNSCLFNTLGIAFPALSPRSYFSWTETVRDQPTVLASSQLTQNILSSSLCISKWSQLQLKTIRWEKQPQISLRTDSFKCYLSYTPTEILQVSAAYFPRSFWGKKLKRKKKKGESFSLLKSRLPCFIVK